jgi:uncharacterized membrane protein
MQTFSKAFDSYAQAERTVAELERSGVSPMEISVVANRSVTEGPDGISAAVAGAGIGAAVGGSFGLMAGLGMFTIPGLGSVIAAGWLAATAAGLVAGSMAGGLVGALVDAGTSESDANVYSEIIRRGGTLVTVKTNKTTDQIRPILNRHSPIDPVLRRQEYEQTGWKAFDAAAPAYQPSQAEIERMRCRD